MEEYENKVVDNFHDILVEICWSIDHNHTLEKYGDDFVCNKLYISRDRMSYKTDSWDLAPGMYEKVEIFYNTLKELEK